MLISRPFSLTPWLALVASLAACQPGSSRPLPSERPASRPEASSWFFRPPFAVEADLDGTQAAAEAVRAVLLKLPEPERGRVLSRWLAPITVEPPPAPGPTTLPAATPLSPESVDVLATLRGLYDTQGGRDLALAAFFLGPEPVDRARQRSRLPPERFGLEALANRLTRRERGLLRFVREARELSVLYGLAWPVERGWRLTSRFGPRVHPLIGKLSEHRGVDIGVPTGTAVRAPADGVVVGVREGPVNGQFLELRHEAGVHTVYCHLSLIEVKRGQKVSAGERVALSGETGRVTGPHLHYQVKHAGAWVDPVSLRVSAEHVARPLAWPAVPPPAVTQAPPL
ncbi:M23 family metallopeptidase [Archangium primigenium]|uniref:M23 family metallopeptidase n=1 Tax=[Archangium] primigenium TaxID=2792470 RepID=UPI00195D414B|nr:M23 family metallopeptidase [Archangium primigenium]MBM7118847.1 M23 family metallopeptidase [Archangium primigenium]